MSLRQYTKASCKTFTMLFVTTIFNVILCYNLRKVNGLVKLNSQTHDVRYTDLSFMDTIKALFSVFKLNNTININNFTQIYEYISITNEAERVMLNEIIKETKVDSTNISKTNMMAEINEVLDGNVNSDGGLSNEMFSSEEIKLEDIARFITEFEELKKDIYKERYDIDLDTYILRHGNNTIQQDALITNKSVERDEDLSDIEFWHPAEESGRRIYRGRKTKIKYFPFMASVQFFQKFQCGGCIVKSDLIITAASCLQLAWNNRFFRENPAFLSVRVGSNFYNAAGESIAVMEVYFHPDYNPKNLRNNLCLMRLVRRIKFRRRGKKVKKIDIDRNANALPSTTDGVTIVGWGARGSSNLIGNIWSNRLSFSVLDFYPLQECQDIYSREYVTRTNFCAGFFSKGGGACNRDVGGPGVVNGKLAGVISFGSPVCGAPDAPTVFTKIGYYADWIDDIMDQYVPHAKVRTTSSPPYPSFKIPFAHTAPETTTFKIAPLSGRLKPIPLSESDALRIKNSDALLNELLNSMLINKNIERNIEEVDVEHETISPNFGGAIVTTENTPESFPKFTPIVTQMVLDEFTTENQRHTIMYDFGVKKEKQLEEDLVKLMDDINLKQIINSKEVLGRKAVTNEKKIATPKTDRKENKLEETLQKVDDSVLTLLYLSDNEKKNGGIEEFEQDGLSIPAEPFRDMTFKANESELFNLLPKNELYDLLSEAIIEEEHKKVKY